ncbi:MAG: Gfo/Idh/MocA family oxidoreductase [Lentisphaerae bacterium]|nr:Gfo/Idh/MocA family oxidoreductase [Lentisphaerota bacterium]
MSLTVGVVGCGNISRFHFSGLEKAGARVKWVCDLSEKTAEPWAKKFGARWTADFRPIVEDPEVRLVDVTAILPAHKPVCLAAIRAGKAVICEKTLAETADDALEIVKLAEEKKTIFYTSYMKRFIPAVEQAKALLPSLGRIVTTHIRAHQCWGDLWEAAPTEGFAHTPPGGMSGLRKSYGGGILVCGGSHILDLIVFLLGRPRTVSAAMHVPEGRDYDLLAAALMETPNGVVHFEALSHPLNRIGFLRDGWDERIEITGTRGRLELFSALWDKPEWKACLLVHTDNATGQAVEYRYAPESPFDRALAFFCANIEKGVQGAQSRFTGYDVDELIATIMKSSSTGQTQAVHWRTGA